MNEPPTEALLVEPPAKLMQFEVDALDNFSLWLMVSGALPQVFDSLVGDEILKLYRAAKELA